MDGALASAAAIADQRQKIEQYRHILASVLSSSPPDIAEAKRFLNHMVSDEVPLVVSRQLLQTFAQELGKLEPDSQKEVAHYALTQIQPRVVSFEEQVVVIREKLAELYESEQQWSRAAQMLSGIDLDSGIRMLDDTNKLSKCVQIARLYLEDDDAVNAEAFINKASFLVTNSNQEVLNLQYRVKRKFLEAALRYYGISQIEQRQIGDEEIDENALDQALSAAITCTVLAGAGLQRSRVLATLYKVMKLAEVHKESSDEFLKKAGQLDGVIKALEDAPSTDRRAHRNIISIREMVAEELLLLINYGDMEELTDIKGVRDNRAENIIKFRSESRFKSLKDLEEHMGRNRTPFTKDKIEDMIGGFANHVPRRTLPTDADNNPQAGGLEAGGDSNKSKSEINNEDDSENE